MPTVILYAFTVFICLASRPGLPQTSKVESFAIIAVNLFILHVCGRFGYVFAGKNFSYPTQKDLIKGPYTCLPHLVGLRPILTIISAIVLKHKVLYGILTKLSHKTPIFLKIL